MITLRHPKLFLFALGWIVTGCASGGRVARVISSPAEQVAEQRARAVARQAFAAEAAARYPEGDYLTGIGESDASASMAELRAVTNAAAAIRSAVERTFQVSESAAYRNRAGFVDSKIRDQIQLHVQTDLAGAIRARSAETRNAAGTWMAVAAGRRGDLDAVLVEKANGSIERLALAYRRTVAARTPLESVAASCRIPRLEAEVDLRSQERLAVSGRTFWTEELLSVRKKARKRIAAARSALRIVVEDRGRSSGLDPAAALTRELSRQGNPASLARGTTCSPDSVVVTPSIRHDCRPTTLGGTSCRLELRLAGRLCGQGDDLFVVIREATGIDSRGEPRAQRAAARRVDLDGAVVDAAREARDLVAGRCATRGDANAG